MSHEKPFQVGTNKERFLPSGYTLDELHKLDTSELEIICTDQGLDLDTVRLYLTKAQSVPPSSSARGESYDRDKKHPDEDLLKMFLMHMNNQTPKVVYDLTDARARVARHTYETIPNIESHANSIYREYLRVGGTSYESGVIGLYTGMFCEIGIKTFDNLRAQGKPVHEVLLAVQIALKNKFDSKQNNNLLNESYQNAKTMFVYKIEQSTTNPQFRTLIQRVLDKKADPAEEDTVRKIILAVKGSYFRGDDSTVVLPRRFKILKDELVDIYRESLPQTRLDPADVSATEIFDVNSHDPDFVIEQKLRVERNQ